MIAALGIDQGTTLTKVGLLHADGRLEVVARTSHAVSRPQPGWVEQDAEMLAETVLAAAQAAPAAAIGLANQGETVVAWDAATGRAVAPAISWQDSRTADRIERLRAAGAEAETLARAGLPLDPYFSAAKLAWLVETAPDAAGLRRAGRLRIGTSDAFLLDRLAGTAATDPSTASRTSLCNLATGTWDPELCRLFGVPIELLPEIRPSVGPFGRRVSASLVDQQAALAGHGCRDAGDAKMTFGTGAFALALTGPAPVAAGGGVLPTVAWQIAGQPRAFAAEGGVYAAAAALDWVRGLGLFADFDELAFDGPDAIARGLVFVPALGGLGCPYWDRSAAGMWLGLDAAHGRLDLCRAVLEGIALRAAQVLAALAGAVELAPTLSVDGGLTRNPSFLRVLARASGRALTIPATRDATALGAARLALAGAGLEPPPLLPPQARIEPDGAWDPALTARFADAVERTRGWR